MQQNQINKYLKEQKFVSFLFQWLIFSFSGLYWCFLDFVCDIFIEKIRLESCLFVSTTCSIDMKLVMVKRSFYGGLNHCVWHAKAIQTKLRRKRVINRQVDSCPSFPLKEFLLKFCSFVFFFIICMSHIHFCHFLASLFSEAFQMMPSIIRDKYKKLQ